MTRRATYRLQFSKVSHLYGSPYLKARPGSTHGYDIVDHNALNPELGGEAAFERMVAALKTNGLKQIVDFVPNHMGVGRYRATSRALVGKGNHVTRVDKKTAQRSQARLRDVHPDAASVIVVRCPNVVTELSMSESSQENIRDCEHRIRERAYHLWEADGCPEGRAQEYWERAQHRLTMKIVRRLHPLRRPARFRRRTSLLSVK